MPSYIVTASSLRIRSGPGTSYKTLGFMTRNTTVAGDEITNNWIHITTKDGNTGWSSLTFLKLVNPPEPSQAPDRFRVNTGSLNIRQGPGTDHKIVGYLLRHEIVDCIGASPDGLWANIRKSTGLTGWSSIKYLTRFTSPPPPVPSTEALMTIIEDVSLHEGPGVDYAIMGQVRQGETVKFMSASVDWVWVQVQVNGQTHGWISSRYVTEKEDEIAPPEDYSSKGKHRCLSGSLGLREGPGDEFPERIALMFNQVVDVDQTSADNKWKHCTNAYGQSGWYPTDRLLSLGPVSQVQPNEEFPWIGIAFPELGTREVPGERDNKRIQEYLGSTDLFKYPYLPDDTEWCAAFLNWCIEKTHLESANSALVFPWRRWGKPLNPPRRGCVVTFKWDDGGEHVSFYLGETGNFVIVLGGDQSDAVWVSVYHKKYITSVRVPSNWPE
jgi:uncharacterized protein (TIGR02594 family)